MTHNDEIKKTNNQILVDAQHEKGYESTEWNTWAQWQRLGRMVKHGEKGTRIYEYSKDPELGQNGEILKSFVGKSFAVFNRDQTEELSNE